MAGMAPQPPVNKAAQLGAQERFVTPNVEPEPKKKQRDMSRSSPAVPKPLNPDLGEQMPKAVPESNTIDQHGPPIPALQRYGVNMSIQQVNNHVSEIASAHLAKMGYNPSPGLVMDLLKSNGVISGKVSYADLFGVPTSGRDARAMMLSRMGGGDVIATAPVAPPTFKSLAEAVTAAQKQDFQTFDETGHPVTRENSNSSLSALIYEYRDDFKVALQDPVKEKKLFDALIKGTPPSEQGLLHPDKAIFESSMVPVNMNEVNPALWGLQIIKSTADMPFGFYQMAKALSLDISSVQDYVIHGGKFNIGDMRTLKMGKEMAKSMASDFVHPSRYGYAAMDLWGLYSLGAGGVARFGAIREASTIRAAAKAVVSKQPPAATEMNFGSYRATLPLSDTVGVQVIQVHFPIVGRNARQANMEAMHTHGYNDVEGVPPIERGFLQTMRTMARQKKVDLQTDMANAFTPIVELQRLTRTWAVAKSVRDEIFQDSSLTHPIEAVKKANEITKRQKLGIEKVILLAFTDTPNPIGDWRGFHERQITRLLGQHETNIDAAMERVTDEEGNISVPRDEVMSQDRQARHNARMIDDSVNAHRGHLELIQLAEDLINKPPARLKPIIDRAFQVSEDTYRIKHDILGLSEDIALQHLAEVGARVRGEYVIDMGDGTKGIALEDPTKLFEERDQVEKRLDRATKDLSKAEATNRIQPGLMTAEIERLNRKVNAHKGEAEKAAEKIKKAREQARPLVRAIGPDGVVTEEFLSADLERLARAHGMELHYKHKPLTQDANDPLYYEPTDGQNLREDNQLRMARDNGVTTRAVMYVTKPGRSRKTPTTREKSPRHMQDPDGRRDASSDYVAALHEIGHKVFKENKDGEWTASHDWIDERQAELYAHIHEMRANGALVPSNFAKKIKEYTRLYEEEASASLWAFSNSAEPLRRPMFEQMKAFYDGYQEAAATIHMELEKVGSPLKWDEVGPSAKAIQAMVNKGFAHAENMAELLKDTPGSAHVTTQPAKYRPGMSPAKRLSTRARTGIAPQKNLFKAWTGDSIEMGDFRYDISRLLAEQMESAFHAAALHTQWKDLWSRSIESDARPSSRHMPIRDIKHAPEELKNLVAKMESMQLDQQFADLVRGDALTKLREWMFELPPVNTPHVRWVDENLLLERVGGMDTQFWRKLDHAVSGVMSPINEPMRLALIFATPAYALNALGSYSLLLMQTGFLAHPSLGRAWQAKSLYGEEAMRLLDRLSGDTHTSALVSERNALTKGSQAFQQGWGAITDTKFRRASVIYELRRHGLLDDSLTPAQVLEQLRDPANKAKINQASQTARKAMLDFNQMSWPEKATLRHLFFVYSFVRASGIWSLRFLRDHGALADVLAHAGENRRAEIERLIGKMPEWFMRSGYFAVQPNLIHDPVQWNMPGMLNQIATPAASVFGSVPYSSLGELLGPAAQLGVETVTGHDLQGNALPQNPTVFGQPIGSGSLQRSLIELWQQAPIGRIATKQKTTKRNAAHATPPPSVRSGFSDPISAALSGERSGLQESTMQTDGWWNTWGQAIFRSALPKGVNAAAGEARYWRDVRANDPEAYHKHEMDQVVEMVKRQAKVVGEQVPGDVIRSVDTVARVSVAIEDWKRQHQGEPQPNGQTINQITLDTLIKEGHIKQGDRDKWIKQIKGDIDQTETNLTKVQLLLAGGGQAWKDWSDRVNKIDSYSTLKYDAVVEAMKHAKLGDYTASRSATREQRWAYGRKTEALIAKSRELAAKVTTTGEDQAFAQQEWIDFVNKNDKPVKIGGVTYPSPFLYEFGSKQPDVQAKAVAIMTKRKPSTLAAYQQQILTGTRPEPIVTKAWQTLFTWMKDGKAKLPLGAKLPSGTKTQYEDYLASKSPEFKAALAQDRLPLAKRMLTYKPITQSAYSDNWKTLLGAASSRYDQLSKSYLKANGSPNQSLIHQTWKDHDVPLLAQYVKDELPATFMSELRIYTGAKNDENDDAKLINFLSSLVSP